MLFGDLNTEITEHHIESFLYEHELRNLIKEKTCFKNMQNPSCIDLLLTHNSYVFQQTTTICSGLSDCHKLVLTVLKASIPTGNPRQITYRDHEKVYFKNRTENSLEGFKKQKAKKLLQSAV